MSFLLALALCCQPPAVATAPVAAGALATDEALFQPPLPGQSVTCEAAIVREIGRARRQVLFQFYGFTLQSVADALIEAKRRGCDVQGVLDASDDVPTNPLPAKLHAAKIAVFIDRNHQIAHSKNIVVDGRTVLSGSFNPTASGSHRNAETLRIRRHDPCARLFVRNYMQHREEEKTSRWTPKPQPR